MDLAGNAKRHFRVIQRDHFEVLKPAFVSVGIDLFLEGGGDPFGDGGQVVGFKLISHSCWQAGLSGETKWKNRVKRLAGAHPF